MAKSQKASVTAPRPYWIPPEIDYAQLPEPVRVAFDAIVLPTYNELVLGAADSLERAAGVTLTFLLALEVLDQFEIGRSLDFLGRAGDSANAERDKLIGRHLRLLGACQRSAIFLARLRELRWRRGPLGWPDGGVQPASE
jgi:hypothetical protein